MSKETIIIPADELAGPQQGRWTYKEYAALPNDGRRYEVMDGVLLMAPSPSPAHQNAVKWITFYLTQYVELTGQGKVFTAPLDVELAPNQIVQPDVFILLQASLAKLTTKRVIGAPDLVVEVSSPATAVYDRLSKLTTYANAGVTEYWIVNCERQTIEVWWLTAGTYGSQGIFAGSASISSKIVPAIQSISINQFFM
jgi:Uma2 family endonuclease